MRDMSVVWGVGYGAYHVGVGCEIKCKIWNVGRGMKIKCFPQKRQKVGSVLYCHKCFMILVNFMILSVIVITNLYNNLDKIALRRSIMTIC